MFIEELKNNIKHKKWVLNGFLYINQIENTINSKEKENIIITDINNIANNTIKDKNIILCFNNKDDIIGYLWYVKQTNNLIELNNYDNIKNEYVWIHSIFVDPSVRKQGVGTYLYKELENICKKQNINKLYLGININNKKAELFYNNLEFKKEMFIYSKNI